MAHIPRKRQLFRATRLGMDRKEIHENDNSVIVKPGVALSASADHIYITCIYKSLSITSYKLSFGAMPDGYCALRWLKCSHPHRLPQSGIRGRTGGIDPGQQYETKLNRNGIYLVKNGTYLVNMEFWGESCVRPYSFISRRKTR